MKRGFTPISDEAKSKMWCKKKRVKWSSRQPALTKIMHLDMIKLQKEVGTTQNRTENCKRPGLQAGGTRRRASGPPLFREDSMTLSLSGEFQCAVLAITPPCLCWLAMRELWIEGEWSPEMPAVDRRRKMGFCLWLWVMCMLEVACDRSWSILGVTGWLFVGHGLNF